MKPTTPLRTIDVNATLQDASESLAFYGIGALPVVETGTLVGIVSERDIVRAISELAPLDTPVSEYMTSGPISVGVDDPLAAAARVMAIYQVRHVPVVEHGRVVDLISVRDLLDAGLLATERG